MSSPSKIKYPGIAVTTNGNQLVALYTESRLAEAGVFYPITPSTEMGENFEFSYARGELNVFGDAKIAIETEGEHAAQGGAIAISLTGKRTVNFTAGQGIIYGLEQYYHAAHKCSSMVLEVATRALTKHALNVHCGHDDIYAALDTGWIITMGKDAQQAADQALILRKVCEKALIPGINCQDGFLTSHLERTFKMAESDLIREFLGKPDDIIDSPTEAQKEIFGPKRRRIPEFINLKRPAVLGTVQNQEHYMQGVAAWRNHFAEPVLPMLEEAYEEFAQLTGRSYGLISEYKTEDAETVFIALGSAAENIEAGVDYLRESTGEKVGAIHINVIRPFPQKAIIEALRGIKNVIVLERSDEPFSTDNPLTRDISSALQKANRNAVSTEYPDIPALEVGQTPRIFSGGYGMGSRDFRPEGILGAYEFATGKTSRTDGKKASDGENFFFVGIDHPYSVVSEQTPSLLPKGAIAIRFHSIGGWGAITTGKNLGEIFGKLGDYLGQESQSPVEGLHVSANPKYGSEKKGAPTNYFLVVSPERIRVNCDLHHVNTVICCDPKAFTHTNPLQGLQQNGVFLWENAEKDPAKVWQMIPPHHRKEIIEKNIHIYALSGFEIAAAATDREDLKYRMQGNAFLGAFFKTSPFCRDHNISEEQLLELVSAQYEKKFGKFGEAVVESNINVMKAGFESIHPIATGDIDAPDLSAMRSEVLEPLCGFEANFGSDDQLAYDLITSKKSYSAEFRAGLGYNQPATALMATGSMAAGTGAEASKYVARQQKPVWDPDRCTQCMKCIAVCPDTALPNTAQEIATILRTVFKSYLADPDIQAKLLANIEPLETSIRTTLSEQAALKTGAAPFAQIASEATGEKLRQISSASEEKINETIETISRVFETIPFAYAKTNQIFRGVERKQPGKGGLFSIFVSDLCKGCGECVVECGDTMAIKMVDETPEINAMHLSGNRFFDLLPETPKQYLGLFDADNIEESKAAVLQNHLMIKKNYNVLTSGDGACAGCGEKTILHAITSITEAYMRPLYHAKANRLRQTAETLAQEGIQLLRKKAQADPQSYKVFRRSIFHLLMGQGRETAELTDKALEQNPEITEAELVDALVSVLKQDAFNHKDLQVIEDTAPDGMCTMAMTASTGCNTVYGSTHPFNPHTYPWMNSLFQDGTTIGWLTAESFINLHAKRSVIPERLAQWVLSEASESFTESHYWKYTHFDESLMTDKEIAELPKVWCIGGDGAFGDIGFQNLSKVVMQNRPNVKICLLDTQVYSNTGGQNSESSPMPGGFDMNQFGKGSQGKLSEKKEVAEILISGHGSPFVAQVSMANSANLYKTILDGLLYRGVAFIQSYTACMTEHGIADSQSTRAAQMIRDCRGMPEFIFAPSQGEVYQECLNIKANPHPGRDWWQKNDKASKTKYAYTVVHWAVTEARFRRHWEKITVEQSEKMTPLEDIILRISQQDIVHRRFLDPDHRAFIPEKGVYTSIETGTEKMQPIVISRQMVLFCIERRKNWRMLQSKAGIANSDYAVQRELLKQFSEGTISKEEFMSSQIQTHAERIAEQLK